MNVLIFQAILELEKMATGFMAENNMQLTHREREIENLSENGSRLRCAKAVVPKWYVKF